MTLYNVHIYREMRLTFEGIEAGTPEAAARIARGLATEAADDIEDCDGEDYRALVDVAGDNNYEDSIAIDFESEKLRKAASELLTALQAASEWIDAQILVPRTGIQATIRAAIAKAAADTSGRRPA